MPDPTSYLVAKNLPPKANVGSGVRDDSGAGIHICPCPLAHGGAVVGCVNKLGWPVLSIRTLICSGRVITQLIAASESFN